MEALELEMMMVEVVKFPIMMVGEETVMVDWLKDENDVQVPSTHSNEGPGVGKGQWMATGEGGMAGGEGGGDGTVGETAIVGGVVGDGNGVMAGDGVMTEGEAEGVGVMTGGALGETGGR